MQTTRTAVNIFGRGAVLGPEHKTTHAPHTTHTYIASCISHGACEQEGAGVSDLSAPLHPPGSRPVLNILGNIKARARFPPGAPNF